MVWWRDRVLVANIESTCRDNGVPPSGEESDIIVIGLAPLELATVRRLEKPSILARPERSRVRSFRTELTTLSQEQVEGVIAFKEACKLLKDEYRSPSRLWASDGDDDRRQFESSAAAKEFGTHSVRVSSM